MSAISTENEKGRAVEARLNALFGGGDWHGTYKPEPTPLPGVKVEIRSTAKTLRGGPSPALWQQHLAGVQPLGVIPIREDDTCVWACIDVDQLDIDHAAVAAELGRRGLPLVVCRSKSGGAHLLLFLSEPVDAAVVRAKMLEIAVGLGYPSDTEIFPKHDTAASEQHKHSAWLNMPYFGGDESARYAVKSSGLAMTMAEFLAAAEGASLKRDEFVGLKVSASKPRAGDTDPTAEEFEQLLGGWLRRLADAPTGRADDTLMQVARDIGRWAGVIELDYQATQERSLEAWRARGKSDADFHAQYHQNVARGQRLGDPPRLTGSVGSASGGDGAYPVIGKIVVLVGGEQILWRVTLVGHGDVTLPVRDVMHYWTFNTQCAAQLRTCFRQLKADAWSDRINDALRDAETEEMARDETVAGVFFDALQEFCTDRYRGSAIEELLLGKPFDDEEAGRTYFRFADLYKHLTDGAFKGRTRRQIGDMLRSVGTDGRDFGKTTKRLAGRLTEVYWVLTSMFDGAGAVARLPLPPVEKPPL